MEEITPARPKFPTDVLPIDGLPGRVSVLERQVAALTMKTVEQQTAIETQASQIDTVEAAIARLAKVTVAQQQHIVDLDARVDKLEGEEHTPLPPIDLPGEKTCVHTPYSYPDGQPYVVPAPTSGTRPAPIARLFMCSVCGVLYGGSM